MSGQKWRFPCVPGWSSSDHAACRSEAFYSTACANEERKYTEAGRQPRYPLPSSLLLLPCTRVSSGQDGNAFVVPPCRCSEPRRLPREMRGGRSPQTLLCWPWPCGLAPGVISDARINLAAPVVSGSAAPPSPSASLPAVSSRPSAAPAVFSSICPVNCCQASSSSVHMFA